MPDPNKPLYKSRTNRILGGECGGLAEWLGWDPTLVRILYVVVSCVSVSFPGIIAYIVLWVIMPEQPSEIVPPPTPPPPQA
jgi:phage shock protein C